MAYIPTVVIVGRPNVGKSTLFNLLAGQQISIVEETPGVTRDRIVRTVTLGTREFDLVDTGGIGVVDEEILAEQIEKQIDIGIELADVILFMTDIKTGVAPVEEKIAKELHERNKKVLLITNKADKPSLEQGAYAFLSLGFDDPLVISAKGGRGLVELRSAIKNSLEDFEKGEETQETGIPRIAVIGRRNVGKSSFVNALAEEERVIVSSIPGTTRDSIDVIIERDGKKFCLIDTAGLQKKSKIKNSIEFYGSVRTERSINRSDGILLFLDAMQGIGRIDKKVAGEIIRKYKPCAIVVNKWDLAEGHPTGDYTDYTSKLLRGIHFAPIIYMSITEKRRIAEPFEVILNLIEQAKKKISTSKLNRIIQDAVKQRRPRTKKNREPKIYYAVQVGTSPPEFRLFTNYPDLFDDKYTRYLANCIRKNSEIKEITMKIEYAAKIRNQEIPSV